MKTHVAASAKPSRSCVDTAVQRLTPLAAALAAGLFVLPRPANAATIAVDDSTCTLAEAIDNANNDNNGGGNGCAAGSGADIIQLQPNQIITLTSALPSITSKITIEGRGSTLKRDPTAPNFRILRTLGADLTVRETTLTGGTANSRGGAIYNFQSKLRLEGCVISGNTAANGGGGIFSFEGDLDISDSVISNNRTTDANSQGGGLVAFNNTSDATLTMRNSTVTGNTAGLRGGGMDLEARALIDGSTISGNRSHIYGGGIHSARADATITNSTISGNWADERGGGIHLNGFETTLTLTNSTLTGNTAVTSGGINLKRGSAVLTGNLISGNAATGVGIEAGRTETAVVSASNFNLFGRADITTAQAVDGFALGGSDVNATSSGLNVALQNILDPVLANNGGPTRTHALVANGPAVNAAVASCPATDQRGVNRPKGGACDIGAFEVGTNAADLAIVNVASPTSVLVGDGVNFTVTVGNFGPENATDVRVFDNLALQLAFVSATPSQGSCALVVHDVICDLGDLANGSFALIDLVTTAAFPGTVDNTASIVSSVIDSDPNTTNNASTASVTIAAIDTDPDQFSFNDRTGVERNLPLTSNTVTITGINTPAPISVVGGMFSIGCTAIFTNVATTIGNGQTVCVKHTTSGSFSTAVNTTLAIGTVPDTFTSTTRAADTTPDQFVFIDQSNTTRNTVRTSNTVTITGIEVPVPISVTGGLYSIGCTGVFTSAASVISSGPTVCVRNTTAPTFNTAVDTKLTVGGTSDTFTTVTAPNAVAALLGVVFGILNGLLGGLFG